MGTLVEQDHLYHAVKNDILSMTHSQLALEHIKKKFELQIHSNRTFSKIRTFQDLLKVLEKRDILNVENLHLMKEIQTDLKCYMNVPDITNSSYVFHPPGSSQINSNSPAVSFYPYNNYLLSSRIPCNPEAIQRAYTKISTEIGSRWKDLGRQLKVNEHILDELNDRHNNIKDRVYAILSFHENNCDPRYWKSKLLDALVNARRTDLKIKVQEIFDIYNA